MYSYLNYQIFNKVDENLLRLGQVSRMHGSVPQKITQKENVKGLYNNIPMDQAVVVELRSCQIHKLSKLGFKTNYLSWNFTA